MTNFRNYIVVDGKSSLDFDVYLSGDGTFSSPEKDYEEVEVPGRNGSVLYDNGRYKNVEVTYRCFIFPNFIENYKAFMTYLLTRKGYVRIEDTYHTDEFRLGCFMDSVEPDMHESLYTGEFEITFNCKPQRFLKKGEEEIITSSFAQNASITLVNPTYCYARPLIRYSPVTGTIRFSSEYDSNSYAVAVNSATGIAQKNYIDCEEMECYYINSNIIGSMNNNVSVGTTGFPVLGPGVNTITHAVGSTAWYFAITPRWYRL